MTKRGQCLITPINPATYTKNPGRPWAWLLGGLLLLVPLSALAEDLFPDKNLEAAVRKYVFSKKQTVEPLVEEDVRDLSTMVAKGKEIRDLTGIEKCRSLALLDLADNEISDITGLKGLTNIQSLDLSKNKIADLNPLRELAKLQYLHLARQPDRGRFAPRRPDNFEFVVLVE